MPATTTKRAPSLFIGVFPCGISYCDRSRDVDGDYAKVAFLPYDTLALRIDAPRSPLLAEIRAHAAKLQARAGQHFDISATGQGVILGSKLPPA